MSLTIPEVSYLQISRAAEWIDPPARSEFLAAVAHELTGGSVDEGACARAVAKVFALYFRPRFEVGDKHSPRLLKRRSKLPEAAA